MTPALEAVRTSLVSVLRGDVTTGRSWRGRSGAVRRLLVGGQIALSVLLLVSAGLFGRSLWNVSRLNLGLRVANRGGLGADALHDQDHRRDQHRRLHATTR
jgi:hypothetical protein